MEGPSWAFRLRMETHWAYLKYVLIHKWWVLRWGLHFGVPFWQLVFHDMSKFSREEWGPYARWFYTRAPDGREWYAVYKEVQAGAWSRVPEPWLSARHLKADFDAAWSHHWRNNLHHWECWSNGLNRPMPMPEVYAREMVADWYGAGYAKGQRDVVGWYLSQRGRMSLNPATRMFVETFLGIAGAGIV